MCKRIWFETEPNRGTKIEKRHNWRQRRSFYATQLDSEYGKFVENIRGMSKEKWSHECAHTHTHDHAKYSLTHRIENGQFHAIVERL